MSTMSRRLQLQRAMIDELYARTAHATSPAGNTGLTFVYRPGGTASANVYTTWPTYYAALNAAAPVSAQGHRPPTTLQVDDSIVSPAVVPAGAYNLDGVTLTSTSSFANVNGGSILSLSNGVTLSWGYLRIQGWLAVAYEGTAAACFTLTNGEANLSLGEFGSLSCPGGQLFLNVTSATAFGWVENIDGGYVGDGTHNVFGASGGGTGIAYLGAFGAVEAQTFVGAWDVAYDSSSVPPNQGAGTTLIQYMGFPVGTTAARPTSSNPTFGPGFTYWDTNVKAQIVWNGTAWQGAAQQAIKPTDQSVTSSTADVAETAMVVTLSATAKAIITWDLYCTFAAAAGIAVGVAGPTGATFDIKVTGIGMGAALGADGEHTTAGSTTVNVLDNAIYGTSGLVRVVASVTCDGTHSGTAEIIFTQTGSSATSTTIKAGSSMTSVQSQA
jgi:hypothetical protein